MDMNWNQYKAVRTAHSFAPCIHTCINQSYVYIYNSDEYDTVLYLIGVLAYALLYPGNVTSTPCDLTTINTLSSVPIWAFNIYCC